MLFNSVFTFRSLTDPHGGQIATNSHELSRPRAFGIAASDAGTRASSGMYFPGGHGRIWVRIAG